MSCGIGGCMSLLLKCFSFGRHGKGPGTCRDTDQEKYEIGTWDMPCAQFVQLVVDHLKVVDCWRVDGRNLRLLNGNWCKMIDGLALEIKPHSSRSAPLEDVVLAAGKFKSLEAIDLVGCTGLCLKEGFRRLMKLSFLSTIKLSGLCITDEALYFLRGSSSILRLSLLETLVTNRGLLELGKMRQLEALELRQLDMITNSGLDSTTQLSELKLVRCPAIADDGLKKVSKYAYLKNLTIVLPGATDAGVEEICKMTQLSRLELLCSNMDGRGFHYISKLVNLTDLCLWEIDNMSISLNTFCLPQLERVCLNSKGNLDGSELQSLGLMSKLSCLQLYGNECIHIEELLALSSLKLLKQFRVGQIRNVVGFQLSQLCQLSQISQLNLQGCRHIGNNNIAQFSSLMNLTELFLHNCDNLTSCGVQQVALMHSLERLTLGPSIDDISLEMLSEMPRLKHLGFVLCNMITQEGLKTLTNAIELRDVCLDWCGVMLELHEDDFLDLIECSFSGLDHMGVHPFRLDETVLGEVQEVAPTIKIDGNVHWIWNQC